MTRLILKAKEILIFLSLFFFRWVPVNSNKVLFIASDGKGVLCNPKYIYKELLEYDVSRYTLIWSLDVGAYFSEKIVTNKVLHKSARFYFSFLTSKYIIVNYDIPWYFNKRKKQKLIQTWHGGGAYKKVGKSLGVKGFWSVKNLVDSYKYNKIDVYLSSSRKFTEVQSDATGLDKSIFINSGMPRNALLFNYMDKRSHIINELNLEDETSYILYAPTYRGDYRDSEKIVMLEVFEIMQVLTALSNRFGGDWKCLLRLHPASDKSYLDEMAGDCIIDASKYEDMQELLVVADVLITDYSSSMWDFSLTRKPGFIYSPDIDEYINARGFYTDVEEWPYPISLTLEQLIKEINNFNQSIHSAKVENHLSSFVSYESVNSPFKVLKSIGVL